MGTADFKVGLSRYPLLAWQMRADGGGQEKQQVDALRGPLIHVQKQCHHQQQQRSAAYAPGGDDAGTQAAEKG